ncbi:MAG: hypothetical protein NC489_26505, partial [Ruminococcus flavefaciens]|nr:hypothetical protein [Ruminococcus flavefaciens]
MADFPIPENVEYSERIRMFEKEDPGHADLFNSVTEKLLCNEVFIKRVVDQLVQEIADLNSNKIDKESLDHVDNTHDIDKPVSTAVQEALDAYYAQLTAYTDKAINDLINGAPTTLDTLKELADAIKKNQDIQTALDAVIGTKAAQAEFDSHVAAMASKTVAGHVKVDDAMSSSSTNPVQNKVVKAALDGKSNTSHTHNYAGSSSAGGSATSAAKLDTDTAGAANKPIYWKDGKPVAGSYEVNKSVPADAKFTDTNTWRPVQDNLSSNSSTDALSAKQGNVLNDKIDTLNSNL